MTFTPKELQTIVAALRTAADRYQEDAETCSANARLFAQFKAQAAEADTLADRIEEEAA